MANVMGLDIGYSGVKVAWGTATAQTPTPAQELQFPAGAGPESRMPAELAGQGSAPPDYDVVSVKGEAFATGVEHGRLQGVQRQLHRDYPMTDAYLALAFGALLKSGWDTVSHLVTGLPTSQHSDPAMRGKLRDRLEGEHALTTEQTVTVEKVSILPQPAGAYLDFTTTFADSEALRSARVLVIDPGFFSVDWVTIEAGEMRNMTSSTDQRAMSVVLEETNRLISREHGREVGRDRLEAAVRTSQQAVYLGRTKLDLGPFLEQATRAVSEQAMAALASQLRTEDRDPDFVIVAGGGADAYVEETRRKFPNSDIFLSSNPVMANARGFWIFGSGH